MPGPRHVVYSGDTVRCDGTSYLNFASLGEVFAENQLSGG